MIDFTIETLVPLDEAQIPGRPHRSTLHRWRLRGIRGHRLETIMVGGRRFTSNEAILRFLAAINGSSRETKTRRMSEATSRTSEYLASEGL